MNRNASRRKILGVIHGIMFISRCIYALVVSSGAYCMLITRMQTSTVSDVHSKSNRPNTDGDADHLVVRHNTRRNAFFQRSYSSVNVAHPILYPANDLSVTVGLGLGHSRSQSSGVTHRRAPPRPSQRAKRDPPSCDLHRATRRLTPAGSPRDSHGLICQTGWCRVEPSRLSIPT